MEVEMKPQEPDESAGGGAAKPRASRREAAPAPLEELCIDQPLELRIEALLLASDRPLSESRLAEVLGIGGKGAGKRILAAIETLNEQYRGSSRAFAAERLAGGWQILTLPAFGPLLHRLHEKRQETRLSQPALETLAIIAYRQPTMRAEIEAIRGVASGEVLRSLMERRLIKIVGRAEELGRPMLYGTTVEFLKVFGMASLDDLPQVKGLVPPSLRPRSATPEAKSRPQPIEGVGDAPVEVERGAETGENPADRS
jgi:segregation and condensation protein B